ncbi:MAG: endolytic transglycosylase MltG, partial [Clostridia bacterium]|nr:endolytic transglycosylase MltG [Clostridia bacterium]
LTPGAICNPSINAVKAALYPAENFPYYYFVSRYNGYMYFAKTYKEHQENIEKAKKEQQEYQEAGWEE